MYLMFSAAEDMVWHGNTNH